MHRLVNILSQLVALFPLISHILANFRNLWHTLADFLNIPNFWWNFPTFGTLNHIFSTLLIFSLTFSAFNTLSNSFSTLGFSKILSKFFFISLISIFREPVTPPFPSSSSESLPSLQDFSVWCYQRPSTRKCRKPWQRLKDQRKRRNCKYFSLQCFSTFSKSRNKNENLAEPEHTL